MSLRILWTRIALQSLSEVFDYTYWEFGESQMRKLTKQIYEATRRLSACPQSGKIEEEISKACGTEYRSAVVIDEIKLLYTVSNDTVYVEYVWNVRMDDATILRRMTEESD